jgi:hypothetical protein
MNEAPAATTTTTKTANFNCEHSVLYVLVCLFTMHCRGVALCVVFRMQIFPLFMNNSKKKID